MEVLYKAWKIICRQTRQEYLDLNLFKTTLEFYRSKKIFILALSCTVSHYWDYLQSNLLWWAYIVYKYDACILYWIFCQVHFTFLLFKYTVISEQHDSVSWYGLLYQFNVIAKAIMDLCDQRCTGPGSIARVVKSHFVNICGMAHTKKMYSHKACANIKYSDQPVDWF